MPKNSKQCQSKKSRYIPYARGFKLPDTAEKVKALGFKKNKVIPNEFEPSSTFFKSIPKCSSIDDWLAQYNEEGQTYTQFLKECPWLSNRKRKYIKQTFNRSGNTLPEKYPDGKIYILPLGKFKASHFDALVDYTKTFLQLPVEKLPAIELDIRKEKVNVFPPETESCKNRKRQSNQRGTRLDARFHKNAYQIRVTSILSWLKNSIPDDAICLIALTPSDLYEDITDLFVAGMAAGNHRVAVFSLCRYNPLLSFSPELWHDVSTANTSGMPQTEVERVTLQRGCRLLVHEICHLLGLDHCVFFSCCMNGSGHLTEDFSQPMMLCPIDLRKLQMLVGFDVVERYTQLQAFCQKHKFEEERNWFSKRLLHLGKGSI